MPRYRIRFFVETPLSPYKELVLTHEGVAIKLFSREKDAGGIQAELDIEAANYEEAVTDAQNKVLYPALDILAFHRNATCLVSHWVLVLKDEKGSARRRFIQVDAGKQPDSCYVDEAMILEVENMAKSAVGQFPTVVLRWLRNAYRPVTAVERFIYAWLALENLAGPAARQTECQKCKRVLHCPDCGDEAPTYSTGNRTAAYKIMTGQRIDEKTFNDWWNRLRNGVFHGGRPLDLKFIGELDAAAHKIIPAVESSLQDRIKLEPKYRTSRTIHTELIFHNYKYVEFETANPETEFPTDLPSFDDSRTALFSAADFKGF